MKKKQTLRKILEDHNILDNKRFAKIPTKKDVIKVVGDTVDVKINGKLIALKEHLNSQDADMRWLKWLSMGIVSGIGLIIVGVVIDVITKTKL